VPAHALFTSPSGFGGLPGDAPICLSLTMISSPLAASA
jgi:hypothetical protein